MDDAPAKESAPSTAPEDHASESAPITQEKSCGWESARLPAGSAEAPSSPGDDLSTALIGSWQHTHIDSVPAPATGYVASAWSADTMLWTNNRDGSLYLLKRR